MFNKYKNEIELTKNILHEILILFLHIGEDIHYFYNWNKYYYLKYKRSNK